MICPLHAWGDESIRSHGLGAPAYLLGASVVDTDDLEVTRDVLRALRPTHGKLHWHDLDRARRDHVSRVLATVPARHLVVVCAPIALRRQERARAHCLRRLLWELDQDGIAQLTLEARPPELMRRDVRLVDGLRAQRAVSTTFRVEHELPSDARKPGPVVRRESRLLLLSPQRGRAAPTYQRRANRARKKL